MVEDGGGRRPIDLLDDREEELPHHELTGSEPRQAGGAPRGGEGLRHLRDLGVASPRSRLRHPERRGHARKVWARGLGESPFSPAPRRFLGELGLELEQPPPGDHRTQEQHGEHL
jgi:hypothetical protein